MLNLKVVIGVSGGPDSMYLLNELINKPKYTPIVVHVNYNFRAESIEEEKIVEDFCNENNVKVYKLNVTDDILNKYSYLGNKQSIARQIRYDEYFRVCDLENTKIIFTAHHKDDFIETAIMQESRSNDYLFYGIQPKSAINGYEVHRPLLNLWKSEIIANLENQSIPYKIDKSNLEPVYERNKVRLDLSNLTDDKKESIYLKFVAINKDSSELLRKVEDSYGALVDSDFDWNTFNSINDELKRFVIYKLLINNRTRINISSDKLDAIVEFLKNKKGDKSYRLMENLFMSVKNSKIIIYTKNYGNRK